MRINELVKPNTPEQLKLDQLRATSQRALQSIYDDIDRLEKTEVTLRRYTTYTPLFQWPLLAVLGLLGLELLLVNTRYRRVP